MSPYVELRCRSAFNFLRGASLPEDLIARAAALGYPALALGDGDGVYGAPRFHQAAQRAGLRAIIGCELTLGALPVHRRELRDRDSFNSQRSTVDSRLYLLVTNRTGYQNLCRLI